MLIVLFRVDSVLHEGNGLSFILKIMCLYIAGLFFVPFLEDIRFLGMEPAIVPDYSFQISDTISLTLTKP
jgi:hypothetical protein